MIVITGGSGLLGQAIIEKFLAEGQSIIGLYNSTEPQDNRLTWVKCNVNDASELVRVFQGASCVIHAAALVSFSKRNKSQLFTVNVEGTTNVVNACLRAGVNRLVHVSSVAALGKPHNQHIITEEALWTAGLKKSYYALTKHLAELEVFRGEAEGLSVSMVNPSIILSAIGHNRSSGKIFEYVKQGRPFYIESKLNFVDARDVANIVYTLHNNTKLTGRFIANGGSTTWHNLFHEMAKRMNTKPPHIQVGRSVASIVAGIESIRSFITSSEPLITKETARMAYQSIEYSNQRATQELGITFKNLHDTLDWCCQT